VATDSIERVIVYVGTYTRGESTSEGVYACAFDTDSGTLTDVRPVARLANPTFLARHPARPYLYSVSELPDTDEQGRPAGALSAMAMDGEGGLTLLNTQATHGTSPCYVTVDRTGRYALVANYGSGSLAMLPIGSDGSLGEASDVVQHEGSSVDPGRQSGPHAHSVIVDPTNRYALAADLGLDRVMVYRLDLDAGKLLPNEPPSGRVAPGAGPRHLAFHPSERYLYVINEMGSTLTTFAWDGDQGALEEICTVSTLPSGWEGTNYCADVHVAPSGRYVYGSNRGHDSIAVFRVDDDGGAREAVAHVPSGGEWPRSFSLSPDARWLLAANQNSDNVVIYAVEGETGLLRATGQVVAVPRPVCMLFTP